MADSEAPTGSGLMLPSCHPAFSESGLQDNQPPGRKKKPWLKDEPLKEWQDRESGRGVPPADQAGSWRLKGAAASILMKVLHAATMPRYDFMRA